MVVDAPLGFPGPGAPGPPASRWRMLDTFMPFMLGILLVAAKLALVHNRPLCPRPLGHDDLLFLQQGHKIIGTGWLGPYDELTLVKGPSLPLFLALSARLGLPFLLSQEMLYLAANLLLVVALAPVLPGRWERLVLFAAGVFNPVTLSSDSAIMGMGQGVLTREPLYASLTLLVVATLIGLWTHRHRGWRPRLAWALGLGLFLGPFWLTREEGPWILPTLTAGVGAVVWSTLRSSRSWQTRLAVVATLVLPLVLGAAAVLGVATLNWRHYGLFTVNELNEYPFRSAYGALTRVRHPDPRPNLPVPQAVRRQIYTVSPAFMEIESTLENPRSRWLTYGCPYFPHTCGDLTGAWFLWAFRDAVSVAGHHRDTASAAAYYERLAAEIDRACEQGSLQCGPSRATLLNPLTRADVYQVPVAMGHALIRTCGFTDVHILTGVCERPPPFWADLYRQVTGQRVAEPGQLPSATQVTFSNLILGVYRWAVVPLLLVALVGYMAHLFTVSRAHTAPLAWPTTLVLLTLATRFAVIAVAQVATSTPYSPRYYQPAFPLLIAFLVLGVLGFILSIDSGASRVRWHRLFASNRASTRHPISRQPPVDEAPSKH